jgi:DNA-directed RNA polymerase subunit RPC12/RpoP
MKLSDVCEHGGYWCRACQRFVVPEEDDHGRGRRCPRCDGIRLRYHPPLPGFKAGEPLMTDPKNLHA